MIISEVEYAWPGKDSMFEPRHKFGILVPVWDGRDITRSQCGRVGSSRGASFRPPGMSLVLSRLPAREVHAPLHLEREIQELRRMTRWGGQWGPFENADSECKVHLAAGPDSGRFPRVSSKQ